MKKYIFLIAAILWTCVIFSFSLQPAVVSSSVSGGLMEWMANTFHLEFLQADWFHTFIRKCGHFGEFFILGCLCSSWMHAADMDYRRIFIGSLLYCLMVASCDETIQLFVDGRAGKLTDVILDVFGATSGIVFLRLLLRYSQHHK